MAKKKPIVRFDTVPIRERELLRAAEAGSLFFGISRSAWYDWYKDGWIPKPVKVIGHKNMWRRVELLDWVAAGCPQESTWRWTPSRLGSYENLIRERQADLNDLAREKDEIQREILSLRKTLGQL